MQIHDLYLHPVYNSYPVTLDFEYNKTVRVDLHANMPSYWIVGPENQNPLQNIRVVFQTPNLDVVPAVYCVDYYAEEIAAEQSG